MHGFHSLATLGIAVMMASPSHGAERLRCVEPQAANGSSLAVVVEGLPLVHTCQHFPDQAASNPAPVAEQVQQVMSRLEKTLQQAGSSLDATVKLNFYVADPDVTVVVDRHLASRFAGDYKPAVSFVATALPGRRPAVAVDAIAALVNATPPGVGQSAGGVRLGPADHHGFPQVDFPLVGYAVLPAGPRVYISGQAEPGDGSLADATRLTLRSLFSTLAWLELSPDDVVQIKAFLAPMSDFATAAAEIRAAFPQAVPPLSVVEWVSTLPIEIELVVAARGRAGGPACEFLTPPGMTASPVFSRVTRVQADTSIYFSGLYATAANATAEAEVRELFAISDRVATASGSDFLHLVKATYYVSGDEVSTWHNQLRPQFYDPARPPAASKAVVAGTGRAGRSITWDLIAVPAREE